MSDNNPTVKKTVKEFHDELCRRVKEARAKKASALKATDPTFQGTPDVPSFNTEKNRSNINLPNNPNNLNGPQDVDGTQGLCTVTNPSGVGQGEYPKPVDGNARDAAYTSPSTPISKIANEFGAQDTFAMPTSIKNDTPLMQKLAYVGSQVLATKKGQALVTDIITKEAGRIEAQNIMKEVYEDMKKEAAANQQAYMYKVAMNAHAANLDSFQYEFEKRAYMQGAVDGDQMGAAMEQGAAPEIAPAAEDPSQEMQISDEEAMAAIQALVESGQVSPEQVNAFLSKIQGDQAPSYTAREIAQMIAEDLNSGALDPQTAEMLAAEVLQGVQSGAIPAA